VNGGNLMSSTLPLDYEERVYAGILGKIIGVYLGRPFEGWDNAHIERDLGEVWHYVHEKRGVPLVVADDDISGTFAFLRALPDHGISHDLTAEQIGKTWLNYLIEDRTVLWWGGMGMSTEHTAYLRLKHGVAAPRSGSIALNGQVVAEQIGAQIFIDGWAMVCPGDPEKAVALARKAASVSHDGEAIYGAQVVAAMEALAFVERDLHALIAAAQTFIPPGSLIHRLIDDLRGWHAKEPRDWRATFRKVQKKWGYDTYGGNCHMIPNHAVILLGLLYGDDDFQKSLMVTCTAGWDTDCNAANVGCLMGIKNGLAGIDRHVDFRGPVADRMYLPTADGGRCITDAARETYTVVNIGRALRGLKPVLPNEGVRFPFSLPGSVHGFVEEDSPEARGLLTVGNASVTRTGKQGEALDERALTLRYRSVGPGRAARAATATFLPPDSMKPGGYGMQGCPTLYPGQTVRARVVADASNERPAEVRLYVRVYDGDDRLETVYCSDARPFAPGEASHFHCDAPDTGGRPIAEVGLEIGGSSGSGTVYLDWMHWTGAPRVTLGRPEGKAGTAWRRAWVNAADVFAEWGQWAGMTYKVIQNEGTGLLMQGEWPAWDDYSVATEVYPHLAERVGVVVCGRGLRRYAALTLSPDGKARLIERHDDKEVTLAEAPVEWTLDHAYHVDVTTRRDGALSAVVRRSDEGAEAVTLSAGIAPDRASGMVGMLVTVGHCQFGAFRVEPV